MTGPHLPTNMPTTNRPANRGASLDDELETMAASVFTLAGSGLERLESWSA